jgi:predicted protein tyrosine phosphatase
MRRRTRDKSAGVTEHGITIAPLNWATRKKRAFERIIGCYDPDTRANRIIRFHRPQAPAILVLKFVDLDEPPPPRHAHRPELRMPQLSDVERALAFDRAGERLLIHCQAGISRSSAIAIALMAARLGPGAEEEAVAAVLAVRPEAVPNLALIRLADSFLARGHRLSEAVRARETAAWTERRAANRRAYLDYYGAS